MPVVEIRPPIHVGTVMNKFGFNPDVDASTGGDEDIVAWGGLAFWPSSVIAAADIDIVSTSTADTALGTGAQTIDLRGLDANYKLQSELISLNGQTDVHPEYDYIRIFRVYIIAVGDGGVNAATIPIDDGTNILAQIIIGFGQTTQAAYTIPADFKKGWIMNYDVVLASKSAAIAEGYLFIRNLDQSWRVQSVFNVSETTRFHEDYVIPIELNSKTDIRLTIFDASKDSLPIAGTFQIYLER